MKTTIEGFEIFIICNSQDQEMTAEFTIENNPNASKAELVELLQDAGITAIETDRLTIIGAHPKGLPPHR